ncbi:liver-expressed antimicrobial peptide 2-like [Xenopus tropicalis]|uniref:Liver-expressed antimicrobial peptide 2-like n=1 Tax=Xenopus tropicalis TaxID=8364 RepID=A0A8J1ISX2_XENTR|nr:liver-expressed antimicrobial peptide 2-like [Xenopus tropicalis]
MGSIEAACLCILLLLCGSEVQSQPPSPDPGFKDEIKKMEWPVFLPPYRGPRMTPFWRTVGSKPLGAYCNQGLECTTKICRRGQCAYLLQY